MEKQNHGTKYLYRKSNCTLNTRSNTSSGASQFLTKSGIVLMKRKLPKTNYYVENGKVKRDLSIATDKCILRGIYKRKFGKYKCSANTPDVVTITEAKHDHNSCGDSITEEHNAKTRLNINVASLVVENLKDLLNDWIKKYLLNNDETKQKIDTVIDSILHNLKLQRTSSSYTYRLDIKVDEKHHLKSKNTGVKKRVTRDKQSCQTVPVTGKHIKLISTLSIPRNIKRNISTHSQRLKPAKRKIRYKNVFLTISRSSTFLLNSSSFNLLSISTKSFIKRCATYDSNEIKTYKKHEVVSLPKYSYSASTHDTKQDKGNLGFEGKIYSNAMEMEPLQSLVKSIYADDPANITSTEKSIARCKQDNCTMTDTDCTLKNVTTPHHCQKLNWKKADDTVESETLKVNKKHKKNTRLKTLSHRHKIRKTKSVKKQMPSFKCLNKKSTDTSNLYKKTNFTQNENNFLKDLQGILKQFIHYTDSKNIKFDVKINIFPGLRNTVQDENNNDKTENTLHSGNLTAAYNVLSTQILPEGKISNPVTENHSTSSISSQKSQLNFISILDGAISQSKYVISKETSSSNEIDDKNIKIDNVKIEPTSTSVQLEIAKDINELRVIIRDLAMTTEKFVKEHLEHWKKEPHELEVKEKSNKADNNPSQDNFKKSTVSKAVQHSSNKSQIMSGLKLKKEPKKKDILIFNNRLGKKSVSYNVIESESILKVTDMTSEAPEISTDILINKTVNCSLPKSKSLFEVTVGQSKRKLLAYYCDEIVKSRQFMQNCNECSPTTYKYSRCPYVNDYSQLINEKTCHEDNEIDCEGHQKYPCDGDDCEISGPGYSCSSVYIDVEGRKKFTVRSRGAMSFWEGLLYCILLWIPVVLIFWLLYVYVIKDMIQPVNPAIGRTNLHPQRSRNNSLFHITLSDLGF